MSARKVDVLAMYEPTGSIGGNFMARGDGFKISFNPDTGALIRGFRGDGPAETAIVCDGGYYILNGDHRAEYAALIPQGLDACVAYFKSKPELHSSWSDQP